jgi:hypothetical protein
MIRAAELRAVVTEYQQYQTAVYTFRDKYFGLPGDLKNATAFWGEAHTTPAICLSTVGTGTQTCDGNGNFTGIAGSVAVVHSSLGTNIPESKLSGAGWSAHYYAPTWAGDAYWFGIPYNNYLSFGALRNNSYTWEKALTPEEAWNLDKKTDDGKPGQGKIIAGVYEPCTDRTAGQNSAANALAAVYDLASTDVSCGLIFRNAW